MALTTQPDTPAAGPLTGQVALVTGAARGQGRAHCLALAAAGADVAALDLCRQLPVPRYALSTREDLDQVVKEVRDLGRQAVGLVADVRAEAEVAAATAEAVGALGGLDVLVNNAAVASAAPFWELSEEDWDTILDTNLKGFWLAAKHATPHLRQAPHGRIVNVTSVLGAKGYADYGHLAAASHGVVGLTRTMAIELAPAGVNVNAILYGVVDSTMLAGLAEEQGLTASDVDRLFTQQLTSERIRPETISNALLWLLSDAARQVTGVTLPVDGGFLVK